MAKWPWRNDHGVAHWVKTKASKRSSTRPMDPSSCEFRRGRPGVWKLDLERTRQVVPQFVGWCPTNVTMVTMVFFEVLDLCFFFKPTKPTGGAPPCSDDRKSFKSSFWRKYREVLRKHLYAFGKLNKWHVYLVLQSQHFHSYLSAKMTVSGWLNLDQQPCTVCIYIYK